MHRKPTTSLDAHDLYPLADPRMMVGSGG